MIAIAPETIDIAALPSLELENRKQFPACSCIYLACSGEQILYIGKSRNLAQRWAGHHRQAQLETFGSVRIAWIEVSDTSMLLVIEKALIEYFNPPLNRSPLSKGLDKDLPTKAKEKAAGVGVLKTRGGRTRTTWTPAWKYGKTTTIRVPIAIADQVMEIARAIDEQGEKASRLLNILESSNDSIETGNP